METSTHSRTSGGLWNNPRTTSYSKETQDLVKLMMQESRLTNRQKKHINECLKNGTPLQLAPDPTESACPPQQKPCKPVHKLLPAKRQKRSAESCRSGDNYVRDKFLPGLTRDLEEEKRRLQSLMATGQEEPRMISSQNVSTRWDQEGTEERDHYQEVLDEIEERRQFLADMASFGQEREYMYINTEISQKIRELELLDRVRGSKGNSVTSKVKDKSEEQTTENMDYKTTQTAEVIFGNDTDYQT